MKKLRPRISWQGNIDLSIPIIIIIIIIMIIIIIKIIIIIIIIMMIIIVIVIIIIIIVTLASRLQKFFSLQQRSEAEGMMFHLILETVSVIAFWINRC